MVSGSARYRPTLRDSAGTRPIDPDLTGLFFDLDGVLWDTSALHEKAFATVCADEGLAALPYALLAGRATPSAWTLVLAHNGRTPDPDLVARLSTAKQVLARRWLSDDPPLSAELGIVAALPPSGVVRGLVTGSSFGDRVDLPRRVGPFLRRRHHRRVGRGGKAGPDPYLAASSAVGLEPGRCWVLEDSDQGLASAAGRPVLCSSTSARPACPVTGTTLRPRGCVASIDAFVRLTGVVVAA